MSSKNFKVVIVGGGVAGLTLAVMLEKFDIDWLILESHHDIAPPVGASIGLFPNGERILDQIGAYDAICELPTHFCDRSFIRASDGKPIVANQEMERNLEERHGYPLRFFDREWFLQVMYDQLKHKERVLLGKRISAIQHSAGGVRVTTKEGESFDGTLVIGADGVHSAVRGEMFRLINDGLQPGQPAVDEESGVPCYYKCSFGIAENVPGWDYSETNSVAGTESSQLVISGPNKRVYWFLFVRLKEPKYGKDIPRYTKGDEAAFREQWADHRITERVTFGQLFENRLSSTLTPLHEVVYKNWWYKRIFLLGDAVHKPNPIGGQGANAAFETAAEFVNALLDKRDERPSGLSGLADDDIADILGKAREAREERARYIVKAAHDRQALLAFEKPLVSEIVCRVLLPWLGEDATYSRPQDIFVGGSRVKRLPMPLRPRATPYADELPSKPAGRVVARAGSRAFMVVLLAILVVVLKLLVPDFLPVFASSRSPPPLVFEDAPQRAHRFLLLSSLISPLLIYTIEGYRYGNHGSPLALPSVFNTAMSLTSVAHTAPIHALLSVSMGFGGPSGRRVPVEVANSLIPALVFGFIIPSVVATKLDWGFGRMQSWQMLFCLGPTIFTGLTLIFSRAIRSWQARRNSSASAATVKRPEKNPSTARTPRFDVFAKTDLPHLRRAYKVAMVLQAASHLATVYYLRHINASFRAVLLGVDDQTTPRADAYLRWNLLLSFGAIAVYNLYVVFDLWARGFTTTGTALRAAVGVAAGQFVMGTGATWAGLWYWREGVLAGLSTWE